MFTVLLPAAVNPIAVNNIPYKRKGVALPEKNLKLFLANCCLLILHD
jgi:hypothetical protein